MFQVKPFFYLSSQGNKLFWVGTENGQTEGNFWKIKKKKRPEVFIFSVTPRHFKRIYQAIFEKSSGQKMEENNDKHNISKRSSVGKGRPKKPKLRHNDSQTERLQSIVILNFF